MSLYPDLSTVNATNDVTQILVYANTITNGWMSRAILGGFFLIVLLGSFFAQMRFSGRGRIEISFAMAGVVTFGLAVIMSLEDGLLDPTWLLFSLGVAVLGALWLFWPSEPSY